MNLLALHKYWILANRMREHFDNSLKNPRFLEKKDDNPMMVVAAFIVDDPGIFMSYWYGGLFVVIEGWRELKLHDPKIDKLIDSPNVDLLRRYRNGAFHFQKNYFDDRFQGFMKEQDSVQWVRDLNRAFGNYFLRELKKKK